MDFSSNLWGTSYLPPGPWSSHHQSPLPISRTGAIQRVPESLRRIKTGGHHITPIAVAIGPYHHGSLQLQEMEEAKSAAVDYFCRVSDQSREAVREKIHSVAGDARKVYANDGTLSGMDDGRFANMMFLDGCFLLQFMISMCPDDPDAPPDPLMSRAEIHTRIETIARDIMLLENQIPWLVLKALMEFRTSAPVPVNRFITLMAAGFDAGNGVKPTLGPDPNYEPPHLLGLFRHRQVGGAGVPTQNPRIPTLSSVSSTAVELSEIGVKLTASKTPRFGDMAMSKRGRFLLFGELSLAPLFLNDMTACWLINMAAYEECVGARLVDNHAASSYISLVAVLMNREDDVQVLRAKNIMHSTFTDKATLSFFKELSPLLRIGQRYYGVFEVLQEYKQERWMWIAIHKFIYKNIKTILALLSVFGVLVGIFKALVDLKQTRR